MRRSYGFSSPVTLVSILVTAAIPAACGRDGSGPKGMGGAPQGTGGVTELTGIGGAGRGTGGVRTDTGGATGTGGTGVSTGGSTGDVGRGGTPAGTSGKAMGGAGGSGGRTVSGAGGGLDGGARDSGTGGVDIGDSAGPSCKHVGPCTATEVMTRDDSVEITSYVYDANQRLLRTESAFDQNGVPQHVVAYSYDEHGWLLESKSNDCDDTDFGCTWFIYTYDSAGRVLTADDRSDYSGRSPGCTTNTYDQSGRLVRREFDESCHGRTGQATVYEYDSAGRLISESAEVGGKPMTLTSYAYDAAGFLAFAYHEICATGVVDETVVYTRDAAGNPLVEEHRQTGGVGDDYTVFRTFDDAGHQLSERTRYSEGVNAGLDLWCWTRTFDPCGNQLTEEQWSSSCDVPPYGRTTFSYECFSADPDRG